MLIEGAVCAFAAWRGRAPWALVALPGAHRPRRRFREVLAPSSDSIDLAVREVDGAHCVLVLVIACDAAIDALDLEAAAVALAARGQGCVGRGDGRLWAWALVPTATARGASWRVENDLIAVDGLTVDPAPPFAALPWADRLRAVEHAVRMRGAALGWAGVVGVLAGWCARSWAAPEVVGCGHRLAGDAAAAAICAAALWGFVLRALAARGRWATALSALQLRAAAASGGAPWPAWITLGLAVAVTGALAGAVLPSLAGCVLAAMGVAGASLSMPALRPQRRRVTPTKDAMSRASAGLRIRT